MKLLIIKPSSLGDIVHGLQIAQSIKEQSPASSIDWVVRDRFSPLVENCNAIDDVFYFQRRKGLRAFINLISEIRKKEYDYILDFQGLARSGTLTFFAKGKKKIGRSDAREGSRLAYHETVPLPKNGKMSHAVDVLLEFLPKIGLRKELGKGVSYKKNNVSHIDERLADKSPIVIIPNSRDSRKEWGSFKELTLKILEKYPKDVVLWDSHIPTSCRDLETCDRFINATGKTNIEEMIGLVNSAKVVIANDCGPMHLAAVMKKPIVAIFGPSPAERFGPYPLDSSNHFIVKAPSGDLSQLAVGDVYQIVEKALKVSS